MPCPNSRTYATTGLPASGGGSVPSTVEQILSDADLTDIPDAGVTHDIPDDGQT